MTAPLARQLLGLARIGPAVPSPVPTRCKVCGPSPYPASGKPLPDTFVDHALLDDRDAPDVCAGCSSLMAGKPGDEPRPVRTGNVLATANGLTFLDRPLLWAALVEPCPDPHVLSWATGGQRHHWLRAGLSTFDRLLVGSDDYTIEAIPQRDRPLTDAILALLRSPTGAGPVLSRAAVSSGHYHPAALAKFALEYGADAFAPLERVVAAHRPSPLLDLYLYCAPSTTAPSAERAKETALAIDPHDTAAAELLYFLASSSEIRRSDGVMFWGGYLAHRVTRFAGFPLATFTSRMLAELRCRTTDAGSRLAVERLAQMPEEEQRAVEHALRARGALLVALAYQHVREERRLHEPLAKESTP